MFVYTAGKDILQNFGDGDQISLGNDTLKVEDAKISAGSKSIKFKFGNKDVLTIKPTKGKKLGGSGKDTFFYAKG